ncbi:ABC transporter permease [Anaerocolumna sp. AGMB13020]|uniref:ABC transporter permease n=1 Tax=Anaerocolumna sp. AGMB13020 TaxID=3081750 RepID=UPI002952D679|nr:ABC transporter permease [Anaerocolumna sp. AGMB13020]WOO37285.1 ABC transporter permease [Anaerocolumna sp. AGMB13020]
MSLMIEFKKLKRTGFLPAILIGGLFASAIPLANMSFRSSIYVKLSESPLQILFTANWNPVALLNQLLMIAAACILYQIEFADNGRDKMETLPIGQGFAFIYKFILLGLSYIAFLLMEATALTICTAKWFTISDGFYTELLKNLGFLVLLALPSVALMTVISSACKNMWISLGIGVILLFTANVIPSAGFPLSLFPFALPFRQFYLIKAAEITGYLCFSLVETVIFIFTGVVYNRIRRRLQ